MQSLHRVIRLTLLLVISLAPVSAYAAQDARGLLSKGIAQYRALNFKPAEATLKKVDSGKLSESAKRTLADYLEKVGPAIRKQAAARDVMKSAKRAYDAGNYAEARAGYEKAAVSAYLQPQTRKAADANAKLSARKLVLANQEKAALEKKAADKVTAEETAARDAAKAKVAEKIAADNAAKELVANKAAAAEAARKTAADNAARAMAAKKASEQKTADELLKKGISQYKSLDLKEARQTLAKVDADSLSPGSKRTLADYLDNVDKAVKRQSDGMDAYNNGREAMKAGDFAKADAEYKKAADNAFLKPQVRADARAKSLRAEEQLAKAKSKAAAIAQAEAEKAKKLELARTEAAKKAAADKLATQKAEEARKAELARKAKEEETRTLIAKIEARNHESSRLLAQGKVQLKNGALHKARRSFEDALLLNPENKEAKALLATAKIKIKFRDDVKLIEDAKRAKRIKRDMANVDFEKAFTKSEKILKTADSEADFAGALHEVSIAAAVLKRNENVYEIDKMLAKSGQARNLENRINSRRQSWRKSQLAKKRKQMSIAEEESRKRAEKDRKRKVDILTRQAKSLIRQSKYKLAAEEVSRILVIDSQNGWAIEKKDMLDDFILVMDGQKASHTRMIQGQMQKNEILRQEIPWYDLIRYPEDWKDIALRRKSSAVGAGMEKEVDRAVRRSLKQKLPKLSFDEVPFEMVVQFLREVGGVSIYVNWGALAVANVEKSKQVNVHLVDVSFETALNTVLKDISGANVGSPAEIKYVIKDGIINITTKESLSRDAYPRVYDIRDLIVSFPEVPIPEQIGLTSITGGSSSTTSSTSSTTTGSGGWGGQAGGGDTGSGAEQQEELINKIIELIKETVAKESWESGNAAVKALGGQLVVTQTIENHDLILDLINQLREARTLQISVETRFVQVSSGFLNSIGLDLDLYIKMNKKWSPNTPSGDPGLSIVQDTKTWASANLATGIGDNIAATAMGASSLNIGGTFLNDIQVDFLLDATQAHSQTKTLKAPRITMFNGQAARIVVETQRAYISDLSPEVSSNVSAFDYEVEEISEGTRLYVRGTVSADRRYVTLTVIPQVQKIVDMHWYPSDPTVAGADPEIGYIMLPEVQVQSLITTVSVPDGGTLLLGGLNQSGESEREKGVPLLSKIPVVNRLFTNRSMVRDEESLLILIKPTIIIQREEEEKLHRGYVRFRYR